MKDLQDYIDENGYVGHVDALNGIGTKKLEFGDSANRTAWLYIVRFLQGLKQKLPEQYFTMLTNNFFPLFSKLLLYTKEPVRHPSPYWWGRSGTMSCDNFLQLIISFGFMGSRAILLELFYAVLKRFGFMWNVYPIWPTEEELKHKKIPDFGGPSLLIAFIRSLKTGLTFLYLLDFWFIFNALLICIRGYFDSDYCDGDINFTRLCYQAKATRTQTLPQKIGVWIYKRFRPRCGRRGESRREGWGPQTALDHYCASLSAPPLNELDREILPDYL